MTNDSQSLKKDDFFAAGNGNIVSVFARVWDVMHDNIFAFVINGNWDACFDQHSGREMDHANLRILCTDQYPGDPSDYNAAIQWYQDRLAE